MMSRRRRKLTVIFLYKDNTAQIRDGAIAASALVRYCFFSYARVGSVKEGSTDAL